MSAERGLTSAGGIKMNTNEKEELKATELSDEILDRAAGGGTGTEQTSQEKTCVNCGHIWTYKMGDKRMCPVCMWPF